MKNALILLSVWVGIIVAAYALVYSDRGVEQPLPISILESHEGAYVDPGDRFSLAIPPGWDLEETGVSVLLTDPSGEIEVTGFAVEEPVPEAALLLALGITNAEPGSEAVAVEEIRLAGASERAVKISGPADEDGTSYGLAYLYEGESIVLLVRGSEEALGARAEDLERIEAGIEIPAAEAAPVQEAAPVVEL